MNTFLQHLHCYTTLLSLCKVIVVIVLYIYYVISINIFLLCEVHTTRDRKQSDEVIIRDIPYIYTVYIC